MADDSQRGLALAHTMPRPRDRKGQPTQPLRPSTVLLHWTQYWEPQCTLAARHTHDFAYSMSTYKESYERRVASLFRAGISWDVILHSDLDSPLQTGLEFDRALCLAIARRASRMGRRKGFSKGKEKVKRATRD